MTAWKAWMDCAEPQVQHNPSTLPLLIERLFGANERADELSFNVGAFF